MLDVLSALLRVMMMSACRHVLPMERADRAVQTAGVVGRLCEKRKKGEISVRGQIFHFMLARQFIRNVNPACCDDV